MPEAFSAGPVIVPLYIQFEGTRKYHAWCPSPSSIIIMAL